MVDCLVGLRVLHVIDRVTPSGGAEVSLAQLVPRLARAGVEQSLLCVRPSPATHVLQQLADLGVRVVDGVPGGRAASAAPRLVALARQTRPDLVSSTLGSSNRAARLAGGVLGLPVLTAVVNAPLTLRDAAPSYRQRLAVRAEGWASRAGSTHVHALTAASARQAVQAYGLDPSRVSVVPRGRDRERLGRWDRERRRQARRTLGLGSADKVLITVGRQEPQKGHHLVVEALGALRARGLDAQLLVVGRPGAASAQLAAAVDSAGLTGSVHLLGLRSDVPELLCAADVFVLPSLWEGLGGSVLEAMALARPVVAFDLPPVREVMGGHGLLAPVGDVAALTDRLAQALTDPSAAARLGRAGQERFDACYDLDVVTPRMCELYARVAAEPVRRWWR